MAFELSRWKQFAELGDPYQRAAEKITEAAGRCWDSSLLAEAISAGLPAGFELDVYNSGSPAYVTWQRLLQLRAVFGDEFDALAALVMHSKVHLDLYGQVDSQNRPVLVQPQSDARVGSIAGLPAPTVTDRAPMKFPTITATGTTPPTVAVNGFSTLALGGVRIEITTGGTRGTAVFRYSLDGGNTWVSNVATAASVDLLVKRTNDPDDPGDPSGLTATFATGTYATDNVYVGTPKYGTLAMLKGALLLYYNGTPSIEQLRVPRRDVTEYSVNTYFAPHRYSRVAGGTRPGVAILWTN
jgi:hypothetical protein